MEEDSRFSHIVSDPKFRHIPKASKKVKIDKRFQSMFKDEKFQAKYTVDKRGRPINHTSKEDLKRYYDLTSDESDDDEDVDSDNEEPKRNVGRLATAPVSDDESQVAEKSELSVKHKSDKEIAESVKKKLKNLNVDYARGESALFSESSSDDEESDEEGRDGEVIEHEWGEFDANAETTDEVTRRIAACNMDWDRIRAVDLMVLLNSFIPAGGMVESVAIYPSEFGKERMQEEEVKGPIELVESNHNKEADGEENEEGSKYHMEKLRKYQLNRLKYYYAVISFDSAETANKVYTECDGMEYESSATKLDLRFIPDDMAFEDDPKEICDKLPDVSKYQPRFFTTTALQQAKVDLTWDETHPDRLEFAKKLQKGDIENLTDADLQTFLASSSGEESEEDYKEEVNENNDACSDPISKYRALLNEIEEREKEKQEKDIQMEVKWDIDLKDKREKLVVQKLEEKEEKTPFQKYLDKRKEKRKEKREQRKNNRDENSEDTDDSDIPEGIDMNDPYFADEFNNIEFKKKSKSKPKSSNDDQKEQNNAELELLLMNEDEGKRHFSLKKIQQQETNKKKSKKHKNKDTDDSKKDDFTVNVDDERFSALFTSHHYNIDPTNPHFKKTKNMDLLITEKIKRRNVNDDLGPVPQKKGKLSNKKDPELNMLVKSVKQKTTNYSNKNK